MESTDKTPFHITLNMIWGQLKPDWRIKLLFSDRIIGDLVALYEENPDRYDELVNFAHNLLDLLIKTWHDLRPLGRGDTFLFEQDSYIIDQCEFSNPNGTDYTVSLELDYFERADADDY